MNALLLRRRAMMSGPKGRLPEGYTEADYLESTAAVIVRTNIYGLLKIYFTAQCTAPSSTSQMAIGYDSAPGHWAGNTATYWGLGGGNKTTVPSSTKADIVVEFTSSVTYMMANGQSCQRNTSASGNMFTIWGDAGYPFYGKIFGDVIITQDDIEVFHGVPCTNRDNVAGYYDLVSRSFVSPYLGILTPGHNS